MHQSISSTTQRKNKKSNANVITTEESPALLGNNDVVGSNKLVATAVRKKFGTSPWDENWLNLDCCGLFCAMFTYSLHFYGVYAVCCVLIPPWFFASKDISLVGIFHVTVFVGIAFLAVASHLKAMTTDPGAVPPDAQPLVKEFVEQPPGEDEKASCHVGDKKMNSLMDSTGQLSANVAVATVGAIGAVASAAMPIKPVARVGKRLCRRCNTFKPKRAHHCSICRRCVVKMDHHCPWVNNCVGIGNHKFFLLFVFYTFLSCSYSTSLVIWRFSTCSMGTIDKCLRSPIDLLYLLGLIIESMLFGLFTSCMMIDQWDVVTLNVTHIDRIKGSSLLMDHNFLDDSKPLAGVNEVFGGKSGFHYTWLSPFTNVVYPDSMKEEVLGYRRSSETCTVCDDGSNNKVDGIEIPERDSISKGTIENV